MESLPFETIFKLRDDYKDLSDDELEDLIYDRQTEAVIVALKAKFPDAEILDGAGKKITYIVEYSVYDGDDKDKVVMFECTSAGPNPEFSKVGSLYVNTKHEFYIFDGTDWDVEDEVYRLELEDYETMGTDYGFPGKFGNFDSSMDPNHYLPIWMNNKWKYAQGGDTKLVIYKYYNSGATELRVDEYTRTADFEWIKTPTLVDGSTLVAYKDKTWLFVPPIKFVVSEKDATVTFTLSSDQYEFVGNGNYGNFDEENAVVLEKIAKIIKNYYEVAVGDVYAVTSKY